MAPTSKDQWRKQFRDYRRSLGPVSYAARSNLIVHRILGLSAVTKAQVVHTYWPLPERGEVDTRPLIATLRGRGVEVVLPRVTSFEPNAPTMEHRRYEGPDALVPNRWGIPEPTGTSLVPPEALDLVLVPALGADHTGHRIGHGAGYYDAFLPSVTGPRIALVYEDCLVPTLPNDDHDVPMNTIVTEQRFLQIDG